jgi:hypothetical protein
MFNAAKYEKKLQELPTNAAILVGKFLNAEGQDNIASTFNALMQFEDVNILTCYMGLNTQQKIEDNKESLDLSDFDQRIRPHLKSNGSFIPTY